MFFAIRSRLPLIDDGVSPLHRINWPGVLVIIVLLVFIFKFFAIVMGVRCSSLSIRVMFSFGHIIDSDSILLCVLCVCASLCVCVMFCVFWKEKKPKTREGS
mmetsp:Transcript_12960/g.33082  ORF Transcript_12960/g.33082 Transcript_12960/m.33082 type:complete len:102 (-) Transcript_12960:221-526(-)